LDGWTVEIIHGRINETLCTYVHLLHGPPDKIEGVEKGEWKSGPYAEHEAVLALIEKGVAP